MVQIDNITWGRAAPRLTSAEPHANREEAAPSPFLNHYYTCDNRRVRHTLPMVGARVKARPRPNQHGFRRRSPQPL